MRIAVCALASLVALAAAPALAHMGSTKYLRVEVDEGGVHLVADIDPIDVAYEIGGTADPSSGDPAPLLARTSEVQAWAARSFVVRGEGGACEPSFPEAPSVVPIRGGVRMTRAIRVPIDYACPAPTRSLVLEDRAVFGSDPAHESVVRVGEHPTMLRAGRQTVALGAAPEPGSIVLVFLFEGALHLLTGYDHVLFLVSLLLVAGEVARREGTRRAVRDVALVVTGFTLGHSVTLIAAALDVVTLPSRLVESTIAASIVAVAVWNLVRPEARSALPAVAIFFGLMHGFGFSSVLRELVLPTSDRVGALLAFNAGIEIAQLLVVACVVPLLAVLARRAWYRRVVVQGGSSIIALLAGYWLIERAFAA